MSEITWTHPFLYELLKLIPSDVDSLIDVGCGRGVVGALMRIYRNASRLVAVDAFEPSLAFCRKHNFYDEFLKLDLASSSLSFGNKEFSVATCVELVEHLPKQSGFKLLAELERVSKKVIVSTPQTFFSQRHYDGNPYQDHVSLWTAEDFEKKGYEVNVFESIGRFRVYPANTRFEVEQFFYLEAKLFFNLAARLIGISPVCTLIAVKG
jgi:ubiquinone/menaquinone biosynthesis C-methylase UbiE